MPACFKLRILSCVMAAAILLSAVLTGCKGKEPEKMDMKEYTDKLKSSYETTANIKYKDIESQVKVYKDPIGMCSVKFQSPDSLKDMSIIFEQDSIKVSYKGLSLDLKPDGLAGSAAAKLIVSSLNSAADSEDLKFKLEEGGALVITGVVASEDIPGTFELRIDSKTGNLLKLSIPDSEFEMDIVNFSFLS